MAIPDAFFKIVAKESATVGKPDVLAFIMLMEGIGTYNSSKCDLVPFLTSVHIIEALTGLDFLTALDDDNEEQIEMVVHPKLWPE